MPHALHSMNLLPDRARWIWVGVFLCIGLRHLVHAAQTRSAQRLWHSGHLLMAIGMVYMFMPAAYRSVPRWPCWLIFTTATTLAGGYAVVKLLNGIRIDFPWVTLTAGLGIMAYMLAVMGEQAWAPLSYGAAICCGAEAIGWFTGALRGRAHDDHRLRTTIDSRGDGARTTRSRYLGGALPIAYHTTWLSRATLGLMAAGMAYMLVAMQRA
jgi:Domain of unknown function (DUF5134)